MINVFQINVPECMAQRLEQSQDLLIYTSRVQSPLWDVRRTSPSDETVYINRSPVSQRVWHVNEPHC
jgi:hypothetical protein